MMTGNIEVREEINIVIAEINRKGYFAKLSNRNSIICDFGSYNNFYFEKLKKNGVNIQKADSSKLEIFLSVKDKADEILKLLEKKDMIIFDLDGVVFDVSESYMTTICETFKFFSEKEVSLEEVLKVKAMSGMNCDWNVVEYLLQAHNINIDYDRIAEVFQDLFYNPNVPNPNYFINKEKLMISQKVFEEISKKYDLVVFSGRLMYEVEYSLNHFDIDKYFYYYSTSDNLPPEMLKPNPRGVLDILEHCPYKTVKYIGDSIDDIKSGCAAKVDMVGVVPKNSDFERKIKLFKDTGAKYIIEDVSNLDKFLKEIDFISLP